MIHIGDTDQNSLTSTSTRTIVVEINLAAKARRRELRYREQYKPGTLALGSVGTKSAMLYFFCAAAWEITMQGEHDIWNTTEVHRAIRRRIGEAFSAGYDLSKPLPDRMRTLLEQLDEPSAHPLRPPGRAQMPAVRAATLRKF